MYQRLQLGLFFLARGNDIAHGKIAIYFELNKITPKYEKQSTNNKEIIQWCFR